MKRSKHIFEIALFFNFRAQKARLPPTFIQKKKKIDEISLIINHDGFHIFVKANGVRRLLNLMNDFVEESENGGRQQNRVKFSRKKSEIGFSNFLVGV